MQFLRRPFTLLPSTYPSRFGPASYEREMEEFLRRFLDPTATATVTASDRWTPAARVEENVGNVMVTVELPGVEAKDVSLSIEERDLVVSGEKKPAERAKDVNCLFDDIASGSFFLRVGLPADVISDKTSADYKAGVLHVTLPKATTTKLAKIPINITRS